MERKYAKKGLTIIAPEVQGSPTEAIQEIVKEHRIEYTVTQGITGPSVGSGGIPNMAVFDTTGKLVWVGHPMDDKAEDAIRDALRSAKESAGSSGSSLPKRKLELMPLRSWTNAEGRQLQAALISLDGTTGHFKLANGRPFDYDITKLSEADQQAIQAAVSAAAPAPAKSE